MMRFDTKAVKPAKIRQEKIKGALQQPTALYPAAVGILGLVAVALFGHEFALVAALMGAGFALAASAWEFFVKGENHANRYLEQYRQQLKQQREQAIGTLQTELNQLEATRGTQQLALFQAKFNSFQQILQRKLSVTELTYNRYLATAEQVYLNGLDNLEKLSLALSSISAIDLELLDHNISQNQDSSSEAYQHLLQRRQLYNQQQARTENLYTENEGALTQLDHVSTLLANTDFNSGQATMDMEQAMSELTRLIENSDNYSVKQAH